MTLNIELQWENPDALAAELKRQLELEFSKIKRVPAKALTEGAFLFQELVRQNIKALQRSPGTLSTVPTMIRSVGVEFDRRGADNLIARIGSQLLLLGWLERGTGVHGPRRQSYVIRPRVKKALYWGAQDSSGKPIIRRQVTHPGMKPRQPFGKAAAKFLPLYVATIARVLGEEARS